MADISDEKKMEIKSAHQLEEWKLLNEYVNKIESGYTQMLIIIINVFGLFAAFISSKENIGIVKYAIYVIPAGFASAFAFLSYQYRIVAILRGHLSAIENEMNDDVGTNIHMWNSALVEVYMARNNKINKYMMFPMFFSVFVILAFCFIFALNSCFGTCPEKSFFIAYWFVIAVCGFIIIPPFFHNEIIRNDSEDEVTVSEMYKQYKEKRSEQREQNKKSKYSNFFNIFHFEYEDIDWGKVKSSLKNTNRDDSKY